MPSRAEKIAHANELREMRKKIKFDLARVNNEINAMERNCDHEWTDAMPFTDFVTEVVDSIDKGVRHGVDFVPDREVRKKPVPSWLRVCKICGKEQKTADVEVKTHTITKPKFK